MFSLELEAKNIKDSKTKRYFKEVLSSYYNENYRSATVLLYSIVLCDLLYKLQDLKEIYGDIKAGEILNKLEETQKKNSKSPQWENELIDLINKKMKMFDISVYDNIMILQKHRHLCAHPIMNKNYNLFMPNKEMTRAHIRNMLEGLFIKPPVLSKSVFDLLIKEIKNKKRYFTVSEFERFINSRFLSSTNLEVDKELFKKLWKLTFTLDNDDCKENRINLLWTVRLIYKNRRNDLIDFVRANKKSFSNIIEGQPCEYLVYLLTEHPEIHDELNEAAQLLIEKEIEDNIQLKWLAWFKTEDFEEHLKFVFESYKENSVLNFYYLKKLFEIAVEKGAVQLVKDFCIEMHIGSNNFYEADGTYSNLVEPNLKHFDVNDFKKLLAGINTNNQTYGRNRAEADYQDLAIHINSKFRDQIDLSLYKSISRILN